MGKKAKVGKARKDKFYKLAKETGYRARSAFKLLQLNRKFEFLEKSRVCIDLCAAPGSWLQVAVNHMPLSSHIIGIDLVPIKPVYGCTTFAEDITTDKCRQQIKKSIQTWKADVVLHDGAPNVGKNWVHDAFAQAELTLSALKLATEFLRSGGWFVTKVFRSKDYTALLWVFSQMFNKVHATKPQASRNESAEIFVVCQGYKAPDKIDPKFLDPKHVFEDVGDSKRPINLIHPEKEKKKADGYADGDYTLHHRVNVTDFIVADNHLEMLADCSELIFDSKAILKHSATTGEIKECCKDIKLLGKKELRDILTWRKKIKKALEDQLSLKEKKIKLQEENQTTGSDAMNEEDMDTTGAPGLSEKHKNVPKAVSGIEEIQMDEEDDSEEDDVPTVEKEVTNEKTTSKTVKKIKKSDEKKESKKAAVMDAVEGEEEESSSSEEEDDEQEKVKEQLAELQDEERKAVKRKRKKVMKEKRKLRDKMSLNMVIKGDRLDITDDISLFDLKKIKNKQQLSNVEQKEMSDQEESEDELPSKQKKMRQVYDRFEENVMEGLTSSEESASDESDEDDEDDEDSSSRQNIYENTSTAEVEPERNPLVVDLDPEVERAEQKAKNWFNKDVFAGLEDDSDEDLEVGKMIEDYKSRGGVILEKQKKKEEKGKKGKKRKQEEDEEDEDEILNDKKHKKESSKRKTDKKEQASAAIEGESSSDDSDDSESSDYDIYQNLGKNKQKVLQNKAGKDGFEIVTEERAPHEILKLNPTGLALGEQLIKSSRRRRELIEESYNRYTFEDDDNLPDWFTKEESRHMRKQLPVTKEKVQEYKERLKAINARPIKKIAEAEARKKKKMVRRMEKARKKAEAINDSVDVGDREKMKSIQEVYKKAGLLKNRKEEVAYVVAKKGTGKRVSRPPGIKGRFKVVDPRLKKDLRNSKIKDKKLKKKGGKAGKGKFTGKRSKTKK